jgi:rhodanese-related sulfurtransferase
MLCLTDPFAMEARKFGLSGRRPMTRNGMVLISKEGIVHTAKCGKMSFPEILQTVHQMEDQVQEDALSEDSVKIISPKKVLEYCKEFPETKIIDVRTLSEFEPDHVPDSLHIPLDELPQRHSEIGQTERIVFMCQAGQRAYSAAEFFVSIGGKEVYVSEGGMSSWTGSRRTDGKIS